MEKRLFKSQGKWAVFSRGEGGWTNQLCDWTDNKAEALAVKNGEEDLPTVSIEIEDAIPASDPVEAVADESAEDAESGPETADEDDSEDAADDEAGEQPKRGRRKTSSDSE